MAAELIKAHVELGQIDLDDVPSKIEETAACLFDLQQREKTGVLTLNAVDWKSSITKHYVRCLECGEEMPSLGGHHLKKHGLTRETYRTKYGMPKDQPLSTPARIKYRQSIINNSRPWEKSKGKGKKSKTKRKRRTALV